MCKNKVFSHKKGNTLFDLYYNTLLYILQKNTKSFYLNYEQIYTYSWLSVAALHGVC